MAVGSALVDRGRVIKTTALPQKVEGTTQTTPVRSGWFKCRLSLSRGTETADASQGKRTPRSPQLLVAKKDKDGEIVAIAATDRIEVTSRQLGDNPVVFEVVGDPEPLRKKANRLPFAWLVNLEQIDEHAMPELVP